MIKLRSKKSYLTSLITLYVLALATTLPQGSFQFSKLNSSKSRFRQGVFNCTICVTIFSDVHLFDRPSKCLNDSLGLIPSKQSNICNRHRSAYDIWRDSQCSNCAYMVRCTIYIVHLGCITWKKPIRRTTLMINPRIDTIDVINVFVVRLSYSHSVSGICKSACTNHPKTKCTKPNARIEKSETKREKPLS